MLFLFKMKGLQLLFILLILSKSLFGQQFIGEVKDNNNIPLIGAYVLLSNKDKNAGNYTDSNGKFSFIFQKENTKFK